MIQCGTFDLRNHFGTEIVELMRIAKLYKKAKIYDLAYAAGYYSDGTWSIPDDFKDIVIEMVMDLDTYIFKKWKGMILSGMRVCDEWKDYREFKKDMKPSFIPNSYLDRFKKYKQFDKNNCFWKAKKDSK